MSQNNVPTNRSELEALATKMANGLSLYEKPLEITRVTTDTFDPILLAFEDADDEFNQARTARQLVSDKFQAADEALMTRLVQSRGVLAGSFGTRWSNMWAQAGWIPSSTAVPNSISKRVGLALGLSKFLEKNPDFEVAKVGMTAKGIKDLRAEVIATQEQTAAKTVDLKTKTHLLEGLQETLTGMIRDVIGILKVTLAADDPRWLSFGLNMPGVNSTPGAPQNLALQMDERGNVVATNDPTPLATRYRYRGMVLGRDAKYRLMASSPEPLALLKDVLPGETLQVIAQAVNGTSQGVACEPVEFTVPVVMEKAATSAPEPRATNGNGRKPESNGTRVPAMSR